MASGHPIYIDYVPQSIYPYANQDPKRVNQHPIPVPPAIVPDHVDLGYAYDRGPFASAGVEIEYPASQNYELYNQARGPYPLANTFLYIAPTEPYRKDPYNQRVQAARSEGTQKSGSAPTYGVYTGRYELESYSYYSGEEEY